MFGGFCLETIKGFVEHIIFQNSQNGYTVLRLASGEQEITCTGIFTQLDEGECIELDGEYVERAAYGACSSYSAAFWQ